MVGNVSPMIYFINDAPMDVPFPIYEILPADCPNELFISAVTLSNGNILPAAVRFDGLATVDIFETNHSATG